MKNRVHLDLASTSTEAQAATVARLRRRQATDADIGQHDTAWVVLADPEGDEFCVLNHGDRYQGAPGLAAIVLDANDPELLAGFWARATGWPIARAAAAGVSSCTAPVTGRPTSTSSASPSPRP